MELECDGCGGKVSRLVCSIRGLMCESCKQPNRRRNDGILHKMFLTKWGNRMTHADAMRIKTNKKRSDGRYSPDAQWR